MQLSALRSNIHAELARLPEVLLNELPSVSKPAGGVAGGRARAGTQQ
jgi:hypothetical protein